MRLILAVGTLGLPLFAAVTTTRAAPITITSTSIARQVGGQSMGAVSGRSFQLTMTDLFVWGLAGTAMPHGSEAPPARFGAAECGASVASPHRLKHERQPTAGGSATTHFYTVKVRGTTFRLFCIADASITGPSDDLYDTYRDGFLDDDPRQLVAERTVRLDATVGLEVHGAEPDGTHNLVRVFIVPGRAFGAVVSGSQQAVSSEEATRFLDSLQFEP